MEEVYIPNERMKLLMQKPNSLKRLGKLCGCEISTGNENSVLIEGDSYPTFEAKEVIRAFGRGFGMKSAMLLLKEGFYFSSTSIRDFTGNKKRISNIKARLIGSDGRAKRYIEAVSGAEMAVYGNTVSFIGSSEAIEEAEAAARTIIEGSSHRLAYVKMEATHRKHKNA